VHQVFPEFILKIKLHTPTLLEKRFLQKYNMPKAATEKIYIIAQNSIREKEILLPRYF